jgi:Fibronectin type III domain
MGIKQKIYFMKNKNQLHQASRLITVLAMFAIMFGAVSCDNDDPAPVLAAPTVNAASAITAMGFTLTWTAVATAEKYLLDVSTANTFATTVAGYDKKEVTGVTTNVTGLTASTKYYFRLYAKKGTTTSDPSAVKDATTIN